MTYAWIDENTNEIKALTKTQSDIYLNHIIDYKLPVTVKKLLYWNGSKVVPKTQSMLNQEIVEQEKERKNIELLNEMSNIINNSLNFTDFKSKVEVLIENAKK